MKSVTISKTKKTPEVLVDYNRNTISITGISIPENAYEFYEPVLDEVKRFKETKTELLFDIYLEYFNSGSSRCLIGLFLEAARPEGAFKKASVNWWVEQGDDELKQAGEVFEQISKLPFNYKEIKE